MLGDPHVITLDGKDYTFNGWGEYTMVQLQTTNVSFTLQGRTEKALTDNGTAINATVFTAFAASEGDVRVSVELEPSNRQCKCYQSRVLSSATGSVSVKSLEC